MTWLTINIAHGKEGRLEVNTRASKQHWDSPCLCDPLTARQITEHFEPDLPPHETDANVAYIDTVWNQVKPGGIWGWPNIGEVFQKVEDGKWLLQGHDDIHEDVTAKHHVQGVRITGLLCDTIEAKS